MKLNNLDQMKERHFLTNRETLAEGLTRKKGFFGTKKMLSTYSFRETASLGMLSIKSIHSTSEGNIEGANLFEKKDTKTLKQFFSLSQSIMFKTKQNRKIRYLKYLNKILAKAIVSISLKKNEIEIFVYPVCIYNFLFFLKHHFKTQLNQLMDITAVDYPLRDNRFEIVYNLLSIQNNLRFTVKSSIDSSSAISSITSLYCCASWWEREVWDMFGVFFFDHPDCRRILTDYGFKGHPLRKDFPLSGYVEVRYDDSEKRVVTEAVELAQEFRLFDFSKTWEQIPTIK